MRNSIKSFTLVELLIVIAILAVLAAAVVIVLNPAELLAQARDSQRVSDLSTMKSVVDIFIVDNPTVSLGTANRIYISLPDTASNCPNLTGTLPTLPTGWQYVCATAANLRNTNGTGWVPLDFSTIKGGSPIPYLPIDPVNDLASGRYYTYVMGGSYELTALMEANKENVSVKDGGYLPGVYETGTHIGLTPATRDKGLIGYWTFDGTGSITNGQTTYLTDSSGKGNNGIASNGNGAGMTFATGKVGNAVQLIGESDYVCMGHGSSLNTTSASTISIWLKITGITDSYPGVMKSGGIGWLGLRPSNGTALYYIDNVKNWIPGTWAELIDGNWHQITGTYDKDAGANNMRFYYDGVLRASTTATGAIPTSTSDLCAPTQYPYLNGLMDDVRVYNRALSDTEVKAIYEATK